VSVCKNGTRSEEVDAESTTFILAAEPDVFWSPGVFTPGKFIFIDPSNETFPIVLAVVSLAAEPDHVVADNVFIIPLLSGPTDTFWTFILPLLSRATILFAVFVVVASILHVVAEPPLYTLPIIYELLVRVATVVPILLADFHSGSFDVELDVKT